MTASTPDNAALGRLYMALLRAHRDLPRLDLPVTPVQLSVLMSVQAHPGIRLTELARAEHITISTVNRPVGILLAAGYLSRSHPAHDLRSSTVTLTPSGHQLLDTARRAAARELRRRVEQLPATQAAALVAAVDALEHLAENAPSDSFADN